MSILYDAGPRSNKHPSRLGTMAISLVTKARF